MQALGQLTAFANLMADSQVTVPWHTSRVNQPIAMAIVMQAMQWGMNPYAVAQKTHLVNGVLGYEAQLVNAVIGQLKRHSWPLSLSLRRRLGALHQDSRGHPGKARQKREIQCHRACTRLDR